MGPSEPEGPFLPEHGRISVPVGVIGVQVAAELLETADGALLGPLHQREAVKGLDRAVRGFFLTFSGGDSPRKDR